MAPGVGLPGRRDGGPREAADHVAREVLQAGEVAPGAVEGGEPHRLTREPVQRIGEIFARVVVADPLLDPGDERVMLGRIRELSHIEVTVHDRVLEVVHRVGDVVGQVHDLRLDAAQAPRSALPHPPEHVLVLGGTRRT